jgi:hypothetical protein
MTTTTAMITSVRRRPRGGEANPEGVAGTGKGTGGESTLAKEGSGGENAEIEAPQYGQNTAARGTGAPQPGQLDPSITGG